MPSFRTRRRVAHSPGEMFDLVADIESYPQFLPLCRAMRLRRRSVAGDGRDTLVAEMQVGYKAIHETFTSRITLDRPQLEILVEYVEGPFSHLENSWTFVGEPPGDPAPQSCTVEFFITYQFRSRVLALLMGNMFDVAFRKFAAAFEARANVVYGRKA